MELNEELRRASFQSLPQLWKKFETLSAQYGDMPAEGIINAFVRANGGYSMGGDNPYIQNRRVKAISTLPGDFTKDQVGEMLRRPDENERPLRSVEHGLEYTAYPLLHMRHVYQNVMTYHSAVTPLYAEEADAKKDEFRREWRLLEKIRAELDLPSNGHQIVGQVLQEGKVFYYPRVSVDKAHNRVNHAFMQQLPSDWTKIVGFNNKSKYTLMFNMMYFMQPGCTPAQFGDLFDDYLDIFYSVTQPGAPKGAGRSFVYASRGNVDLAALRKKRAAGEIAPDREPDVYYQNGRWFYWVTLPIDRVFTFEADDAVRTAISPFTGLFLSMIQLAQYEQVQLELVQNPLVSLLFGEIPYRDEKKASQDDPYRLSFAGIKMFEALWYQMLAANSTGGIGIYMAPLENMQLKQLAEAPSATNISSAGYAYTMAKAGVSAIIPSSDDPRVGMAQISLQIESRFPQLVYRGFERMFRCLIERLNLKYEWRFTMFGDIATDKEAEESARKGMTLGILPDTVKYLAIHDSSLLEDMSVSNAVLALGIMDKRRPLVTSYSAKNPDSGLPPEAKKELDPGGRPSSEGAPTSDGNETDIDQGKQGD